jgi:uncharacterized membrane protein
MSRKELSKRDERALERQSEDAIQGPSSGRRDLAALQGITLQAFAWRGPLPPPDVLAEYGFIEGAPKRLLDLMERQVEHRMKLENRESLSEAFQRVWGGISATLIALAGMGVGGWLMYTDHAVTGLAALFLPLSTLAAVAAGRRRGNAKPQREPADRRERADEYQAELPFAAA